MVFNVAIKKRRLTIFDCFFFRRNFSIKITEKVKSIDCKIYNLSSFKIVTL